MNGGKRRGGSASRSHYWREIFPTLPSRVACAIEPRLDSAMEFDLFDTPAPKRDEPRVYSVTEITRAVRTVIEESVGTV